MWSSSGIIRAAYIDWALIAPTSLHMFTRLPDLLFFICFKFFQYNATNRPLKAPLVGSARISSMETFSSLPCSFTYHQEEGSSMLRTERACSSWTRFLFPPHYFPVFLLDFIPFVLRIPCRNSLFCIRQSSMGLSTLFCKPLHQQHVVQRHCSSLAEPRSSPEQTVQTITKGD
jgi:hypothetical protein